MRHNRNKKGKKERCKVCEIIRHSRIAGTEKHVYLLVSNFDEKILEISVCTFEHGELVDNLRKLGIETQVIPKSYSPLHFLKLIIFLYQKRFDIVHCHSGGYACLAAKLVGIKGIIYTKHGIGFTAEELQKRSFLRKLRDFLIDKCVTKYIALTKYDKYIMIHVLHIAESKITIIHNGIEPSFARMKITEKTTYPIVGVVSRLTRQKGISYLIKTVPDISRVFSNIRVLVAGSGEEEKQLKDLARKLGVAQKVEFLGYVNNVAEVINRMDVFVLPSVWEGFPYVLLEAMILKKPIVATDIFGIQEIISNNKNGILVKPKSPDSIAKAIIEFLTDKKKAKKLGEAAYKKVIKHYTLEGTVSKIQTLYSHLLENQ